MSDLTDGAVGGAQQSSGRGWGAQPSGGDPGQPGGDPGEPYSPGPYGFSGPPPGRNNPFAIGALVASVCGFIPVVGLAGAIGGIVMGVVARRQIRDGDGTEGGQGLATAGIVIGLVSLVVGIFFILVIVATMAGHLCTTVNGSTTCKG